MTAVTGTDLTGLLAAAAAPLLAERQVPGLAMGVVRGTGEELLTAGWAAAGRLVGPRTRFALGSLTKTFTALLLAEMAERGEVGYQDPIDRHLPPGAAPRSEVTLLELATHTGGLPKLPPNLYRRGARHWISNPYRRYRPQDLYAATARLHPVRRGQVRYSTFGVGLLGQLLANAARTDYPTLLTERVLRPLGMRDSAVAGPHELLPGAATGFHHGRAVEHWTFDALAGAGGLYTSGPDLMRFLTAQLHPERFPALTAALTAGQLPRTSGGPGTNRVALVWNQREVEGRSLLWHTGGTRGFTAHLGFSPDAGAGAMVLANTGPTLPQPVVRAGRRLLKASVF
ncbi:serine hydrolase domain-containing protein [Kitasatospora viridis]|uniref:CubicO group peptidase (Beta-lactamase class C family) n=1 Tax=Kitasatospora viridis TaxID=281105 RepID=A0A561UP25_9ACTN|nr:serine hydrolase domain-containing protein [Kitasatospora viridis]TWG01100.1 CubicO group peptidase (beta-lactamase class C family) [Kitasatospora viridis]